MTEKEYIYDVAFSFLQQDESISFKINDLIQDRFMTFIYSHHQREIAGKDGEETFNKVFGEDSRTVVVLYRDGWGKTSWTRVEETAIRNRAIDEGYDFVTFILLDKDSKVPRWLPKARIWVDYERWKESGAASVIEARIQDFGGQSRLETTEDQFKRLKRKINFEQEKYRYLNSVEASNDAQNNFNDLVEQLKLKILKLTDPSLGFTFSFSERSGEYYIIRSNIFNLHFYWSRHYSNSLSESKLSIMLSRYAIEKENPFEREQENKLIEKIYDFDINNSNIKGWTERTKVENFYSNEQLIENWLRTFLDKITDRKVDSLKIKK